MQAPPAMISALLPIETPEGISFNYELASLSSRGFAYLIDWLIRGAVLLVVGVLLAILVGAAMLTGEGDWVKGLWTVLYFVLEWGYYVFFDMLWDGQSPGKRLFSLRVIKAAGHPIGFYDSMLRNLLRAADLIPFTYAVGALTMLATRRFQRLGDLAADTIVVHEKRTWFAGKTPRVSAPVAPDLRRLTLSNPERRLLEEFMARKDRLHPDRREELAAILAGAYSRRFGLPMQGEPSALLARLHSTSEEAKP